MFGTNVCGLRSIRRNSRHNSDSISGRRPNDLIGWADRFALEESVAKHPGIRCGSIKVTHPAVEVVTIDDPSRDRAIADIRDHSRESLSRECVNQLWATSIYVDRARGDA